VKRVEAILDMHPQNLHIDISLDETYAGGLVAFYADRDDIIIVHANKITEGVFAREIARAIICSYFEAPPSKRVQDILSQYIDTHSWSN